MTHVTIDTLCPLPGDTWLWVCPEGPTEAEAEALQPADPSCSIPHPGMCYARWTVSAMPGGLLVPRAWAVEPLQPCPLPERNGSFCCGSSHGKGALWKIPTIGMTGWAQKCRTIIPYTIPIDGHTCKIV